MSDKYLYHPILSSRCSYPWPNRFEEPFFAEGNGFRLGCRYQGQLQQENESRKGTIGSVFTIVDICNPLRNRVII